MMDSNIEFLRELKILLNKYNQESYSDTPDFIIAGLIRDCLDAFNTAIVTRDQFKKENSRR